MKFGVIFPQTEFGSDSEAIRDFAQAIEDLGYDYISIYDHVLGVNPDRLGGWQGPYTFQSAFLEPFVLYGFMAAVTRRLALSTGIMILPQRQTALVAKQAATLDILSNGRMRLGVGLGWNGVEYTCLNENFRNRGRRLEEQIQLLRLLWTQPLVTFKGRWHDIPDAGINPLPVQRPIPIWFGGRAEPALSRAARLGDGWIASYRTPAEAEPSVRRILSFLEEAGRVRADFGLDMRIYYGDGNPDGWKQTLQGWQAIGATHISFNTMNVGFSSLDQHLSAIQRFARELGIT